MASSSDSIISDSGKCMCVCYLEETLAEMPTLTISAFNLFHSRKRAAGDSKFENVSLIIDFQKFGFARLLAEGCAGVHCATCEADRTRFPQACLEWLRRMQRPRVGFRRAIANAHASANRTRRSMRQA